MENVLDACSVFNMAGEDTEPTKDFNFAKNCQQMERGESANHAALFVAICSGCIGSRMAKLLFFILS